MNTDNYNEDDHDDKIDHIQHPSKDIKSTLGTELLKKKNCYLCYCQCGML